MGTPDFAVDTLTEIVAANHEVIAVVTQPDKPKGRGHEMFFPPVKEVALKLGLPVHQPSKVKDEEFVGKLKELKPDAIVVVAFGQIISQDILDIPQYGCINVHGSLLPKYRGAAPIQWAIIDGEKESGVTIMRMDAGIDTGDMITKVVVPLGDDETGGSLFDKLKIAGAKLLVETLVDIENGKVTYEAQPKTSPTPYAKMIKKQMGEIDFNEEAITIERLIRGLNPWPSAYTKINGKTLKIWRAKVNEDGSAEKTDTQIAIIVKIDSEAIWVQTGKGLLGITELQLEGKKRMASMDFLRGFDLKEGIALGE